MVWTHTRAKRRLSGAVPRPSRAPAPAPGWLVVAFQWRDPEAGPVPNRFVPAPRTGKPPDSSSRLSHPVLLVRVQLREGAGPRAIRPRTSRRLALLAPPTAATPPPRRSCPSTAPPCLRRPATGELTVFADSASRKSAVVPSRVLSNSEEDCYPIFRTLLEACRAAGNSDGISQVQAAV